MCGYPPFYGDSDKEVLQKVRLGQFDFPDEDWKEISDEAKRLIGLCLTKDENKRISAKEAVEGKWISATHRRSSKEDINLSKKIISNFKQFRQQCKLKKLVVGKIAKMMSVTELEGFTKLFHALDDNNDGMLTMDEITLAFKRNGVDVPEDFQNLLRELDVDNSGSIDYTEFLAGALDKCQYMLEQYCWAAFREFDLDGDGKISKEELQKVCEESKSSLGQALAGSASMVEAVQEMMQSADKNDDGVIDFDEFLAMMKGDGRLDEQKTRMMENILCDTVQIQ